MGSQVSQISAVFYPNRADHYIKDQLGIKWYGRYMDDGYIICKDLKTLREVVGLFEDMCEKCGIKLNEDKLRTQRLTKDFVFLKKRYHITKKGKIIVRCNPDSAKNERKKLRNMKRFYDEGLVS